jgi:DNA-binding protein H-NS
MKKSSNQKPEAKASIEKKAPKQEVIQENNALNNNQIIESIQYYMSEIKKHRENLQKKGFL